MKYTVIGSTKTYEIDLTKYTLLISDVDTISERILSDGTSLYESALHIVDENKTPADKQLETVDLRITYSQRVTGRSITAIYESLRSSKLTSVILTEDEQTLLRHFIAEKRSVSEHELFDGIKTDFAIMIYYSWGEYEDPIPCKSFRKAYKKLKKIAMHEMIEISLSHDNCSPSLTVKNYDSRHEHCKIQITYPYNNSFCTYEIVKLK